MQNLSAQLTDDFADGDFTVNPTWGGDHGLFTITSGQLNSQNSVANSYYLSTPSTVALNAQWDFFFNMKFSTSGVNYVDVYLISDVADITNPNNGYFVRIGGTLDEISLYKMVAGTSVILIDGPDGSVNSSSNNPFDVRVARDAMNNWTLFYDDGLTGNMVSYGTVNDNTVDVSNFFGIAIKQSTAVGPINNHFFDNINISTIVGDTSSPIIDSVVVVDSTRLDVYFNESVNVASAETTTNYSVNGGIGNPHNVNRDGVDSSVVHLTFSIPFNNGQIYELTITNIEDTTGNAISSTAKSFIYWIYTLPIKGDILINEIFADPTPQVGLPSKEYVELYNTSDNIYDLSNWKFVNTTTTKILPSFRLAPNNYVILCDVNDTSLYTDYGDVIGINSFSALTNGGDSLTLIDNNNIVIDKVAYDISWYQDSSKDDGGWSLELINPNYSCNNAINWKASINSDGGTPGVQNSVFDTLPDTQEPILMELEVLSTTQLNIQFNEIMDSASLASATYTISNGVSVAAIAVHPNLKEVTLTVTPFIETSRTYALSVSGASDCSGNTISNNNTTFFISDQGAAGDIVINEVLFNPFTGGYDFVELYNNSNKFINLENWSLANLENDSIDNYKTIADEPKLLLPGEFLLLSKDVQNIEQEYINAATEVFWEMESLPAYNNDEGSVYLINNLDEVVDELHYNEDMHFSLLTSFEGVSLERIDYNRPSNDKTNWHSAAEGVGFATPGYENSQYMKANISDEEITIEPETFSPNNDGVDDVVNITYQFAEPGYVANVLIYDVKGRLVKNLIQNELLGTSGAFSWDGVSDASEKGRVGIHIIYVEVFDLKGNVKSFKKTCVLAGYLK